RKDDDPFAIDPREANTGKLGWRGSASGGSYGTAGDLLRFARALQGNTLVSGWMRDSLTAPRNPVPPRRSDGYGFFVSEGNGRRVAGHGGGGQNFGICDRFDTFLDGSFTVVVLTNYDPPVCEDL